MTWTTLRQFNTARFSVALQWTYEESPDTSWMNDDQRKKLNSGEWTSFVFRVCVYYAGHEIAADYLGDSVYADPTDFGREHFGNSNCYFPDMLRQAIGEARKLLCNIPRLRC